MEMHDRKEDRGFSLIETCIAMVMLMVIVCGVLPLGVYALKYNSAAAILANAITAAQRKFEQLRADPFTACISSSEVVTWARQNHKPTPLINSYRRHRYVEEH